MKKYFYQLGIFNYFNVSREKVIHRTRNNLSTSIYKLNDWVTDWLVDWWRLRLILHKFIPYLCGSF